MAQAKRCAPFDRAIPAGYSALPRLRERGEGSREGATPMSAPPRDVQDEELVQRAQGGDREAFSLLVRRYEDRVFRLASRIVGDPDDAEDVLQETFLSAYRGLSAFKGESRFSTWIFRITTNAALMRLRKRRPDVVSLDAPADLEGAPELHEIRDWTATPEEALADGEARQAMDAAIAELPTEQRAVFLLRDVEGLSNGEVADSLGLTVPAVKSRLHRARLLLRDRLQSFFTGGPAGCGF